MTRLRQEVIEKNPQYAGEVIFVDDGSGDGSLDELLGIWQDNPKLVKVIKLVRNFGQVNALLAGFSHSRGKCVIAISADGQDPPGLINEMLKAHFQEGFEVVVCTRKGRDESYFRILTSRIFYAIMRKLAFPNMPKGGFDFVLLGQRPLRAFLRNVSRTPFFQGEILQTGFQTKSLEYHRQERITGKSRWTFGKKLTYLIDGVIAHSFFPIRVMSAAGILLALLGFLYALIVVLSRLVLGNPVNPKGWTPMMVVVLLLGGFQMLMLGILGEYVWRTLSEVRRRDLFLIDAVYGDEEEDPADAHPEV